MIQRSLSESSRKALRAGLFRTGARYVLPVWLSLAFLATPALRAEEEGYSVRPPIRSERIPRASTVSPARRPGFVANLRLNAMIEATSRGAHVFYNGRDGEFGYDDACLRRGEEASPSLHLINLSRAIAHDPAQVELMIRYLREAGMIDLLRNGETIVFADTGWRGESVHRMVAAIRRHFESNGWPTEGIAVGRQIQVQFAHTLVSNGIPPSRTFFYSLDPSGLHLDPYRRHFAIRGRLRAYENATPHYTESATQLRVDEQRDRVDAYAPTAPEDREAALSYLAELRLFATSPESVALYRVELQWWNRLEDLRLRTEEWLGNPTELAQQRAELVSFLRATIDDPPRVPKASDAENRALGEARVRDALDYLRLRRGWAVDGSSGSEALALVSSTIHTRLADVEFAPNRGVLLGEFAQAMRGALAELRGFGASPAEARSAALTATVRKARDASRSDASLAVHYQLELGAMLLSRNDLLRRTAIRFLTLEGKRLTAEALSEIFGAIADPTYGAEVLEILRSLHPLADNIVADLGGAWGEGRFAGNPAMHEQVARLLVQHLDHLREAPLPTHHVARRRERVEWSAKLALAREHLRALRLATPEASTLLRTLLAILLSRPSSDQRFYDALAVSHENARALEAIFGPAPVLTEGMLQRLQAMGFAPASLPRRQLPQACRRWPAFGTAEQWATAAAASLRAEATAEPAHALAPETALETMALLPVGEEATARMRELLRSGSLRWATLRTDRHVIDGMIRHRVPLSEIPLEELLGLYTWRRDFATAEEWGPALDRVLERIAAGERYPVPLFDGRTDIPPELAILHLPDRPGRLAAARKALQWVRLPLDSLRLINALRDEGTRLSDMGLRLADLPEPLLALAERHRYPGFAPLAVEQELNERDMAATLRKRLRRLEGARTALREGMTAVPLDRAERLAVAVQQLWEDERITMPLNQEERRLVPVFEELLNEFEMALEALHDGAESAARSAHTASSPSRDAFLEIFDPKRIRPDEVPYITTFLDSMRMLREEGVPSRGDLDRIIARRLVESKEAHLQRPLLRAVCTALLQDTPSRLNCARLLSQRRPPDPPSGTSPRKRRPRF